MELAIRAATSIDVDAVVALHDADAARWRLLESLIGDGQCLVACESDRVVGFVAVRPGHFFDRDFVELLLVDRNCRRRGIGSALLHGVVATEGSAVVFTSTNESNVAMRALLAREAWIPSGRVSGLDPGDDELFFRIDR